MNRSMGLTVGELLAQRQMYLNMTAMRLSQLSGVSQADIRQIMLDVQVDDYENKAVRLVRALGMQDIIEVPPDLSSSEEIIDPPIRRLVDRFGLGTVRDLANVVEVNAQSIYRASSGHARFPERLLQFAERYGEDRDKLEEDQRLYMNHIANKAKRLVRIKLGIEDEQLALAAGTEAGDADG